MQAAKQVAMHEHWPSGTVQAYALSYCYASWVVALKGVGYGGVSAAIPTSELCATDLKPVL